MLIRLLTRQLFLGALLVLGGIPAHAQEGIREEVVREEPKLTKPPTLIKFVEAIYPPEAREKGIQGAVTMTVIVSITGKVTKIDVLASPDSLLSQAAMAAVSQFEFSPAEVDHKPAPVQIQYSYNFALGIQFKPRVPLWMQDRKSVAVGEDILIGKVREQGTRLPIPGAAVAIPDLGLEVKADDKSAFAIKEIPPGKYKVIALSAEHQTDEIEVEILAGKQTQIEFYLPQKADNPYEIVVRGKRRKTVVTRVSLREKELTTVPGTFGDPIRVVENLPGVARLPFVGGGLLIRGAAPNDSGVFLDGIKIPLLYHFLGGPSVLNPNFLDRIDYYPGNVDVRYGRLVAGVVDVTTKSTKTEQLSGAADINLLNTSVMLKVPLSQKVTISGAVRRSYIDAILPTILKASDRRATTIVPIYWDYQLRVDVELSDRNQLFFLVFGSDDTLGVATNEPEDKVNIGLDTQTSFHRILSQWRWQISDRLVSKLTPSFGIDYVMFDTGDTTVDLRTMDFSMREHLEFQLAKNNLLRGGFDLNVAQETFRAEVPLPKDFRNPGMELVPRFSEEIQAVDISQWRLGLGAYFDFILDLTDRFQIIPGTRFELFRFFGHTKLSVEPRLTLRYDLLPKTTLKAAAGMYAQAPSPQEASDQFGNPTLGLEQAAHFSMGMEQQILPALSLDAKLYYLRRFHSVVPTSRTQLVGDTLTPVRFSNNGEGYSYGLEVLLKHDVTRHFYGWIAYTLSRTEAQRKEDGEFVPFVFDQTHILTLVASVRLGVGWEVGTRFRLVSGRPDTPMYGGIFDADRGRYRQVQGELLSDRLPLFHQLDFRVEKTWMFKLWRLSAYLDIQNVYNAVNQEATLYDFRFQDSAPLRGLPIIPTLGLKGSF